MRASAYVRERVAAEGNELQRLRAMLAERGLAPRRKLGQNFLVREDVAERIAEHCRLREEDVAVEIGPGAGALTTRIAHRVRQLVAIEKDAGLAEYLREAFAEVASVAIVEGDVLEQSLGALASAYDTDKVAVIGNIPYYITTPILEWLFAQRDTVRTAVLLVQKEYAERLAAPAGSPAYGSLTLFARYHALLEPLMTVRAGAFWPRPDVDSMLVRFFMRESPPVEASEVLLFRIIRGAFHMRRKQLANTLEAALGADRDRVERIGRAAGIDVHRRGETLTLDEFARLARAAEQVLGPAD